MIPYVGHSNPSIPSLRAPNEAGPDSTAEDDAFAGADDWDSSDQFLEMHQLLARMDSSRGEP
jgi:hypothetical protein